MYSYCYVCSVYCLCVNVYCTTATGCHPIAVNKYISYHISYIISYTEARNSACGCKIASLSFAFIVLTVPQISIALARSEIDILYRII